MEVQIHLLNQFSLCLHIPLIKVLGRFHSFSLAELGELPVEKKNEILGDRKAFYTTFISEWKRVTYKQFILKFELQ